VKYFSEFSCLTPQKNIPGLKGGIQKLCDVQESKTLFNYIQLYSIISATNVFRSMMKNLEVLELDFERYAAEKNNVLSLAWYNVLIHSLKECGARTSTV